MLTSMTAASDADATGKRMTLRLSDNGNDMRNSFTHRDDCESGGSGELTSGQNTRMRPSLKPEFNDAASNPLNSEQKLRGLNCTKFNCGFNDNSDEVTARFKHKNVDQRALRKRLQLMYSLDPVAKKDTGTALSEFNSGPEVYKRLTADVSEHREHLAQVKQKVTIRE